jgi:hypothetical protein
MSGLLMTLWRSCLVCALVALFPAAAADEPNEAQPLPVPLVFPEPLQTRAVLAAGYGEPARLASGAWISSDGKSVAFFTQQSSARELSARSLVVKDVDSNAVIYEKVLFAEEESAELSGPDLERLVRARAWEARSYLRQSKWKPLPYQELPHSETEFMSDACFSKQLRPKRTMSVGDLKISYQEPRVQIWRRGKRVLDRRFPSWRVKWEFCEKANPSWLQGAFVSHEQGVVLLELNFCGVDLCPEPPLAFHVLRLPRTTPRAEVPPTGQVATLPTAPFVGYEQEGYVKQSLYALNFPAISEDGTLVALAEVSEGGKRREPNLLLTVRRVQTQELVWKLPVLESRQQEEAEVLRRIHEANAWLGKTSWVPLEEQPLQPMVTASCQEAPAQELKLPALDLTFHQGHLVLKRGEGTAPLELSLASPAGEACQAASRTFLDAVYVDRPRGVALLRLSTCHSESCPRQDTWYHALSLR